MVRRPFLRGCSGHPGHPPPGKQQTQVAADGPGEQPGQPVPVRPALAPVRDDRGDAHHFAEDEEPEHMPCGATGSKAGAQPGTETGATVEEVKRKLQQSGTGGVVVGPVQVGVGGSEEKEKTDSKSKQVTWNIKRPTKTVTITQA